MRTVVAFVAVMAVLMGIGLVAGSAVLPPPKDLFLPPDGGCRSPPRAIADSPAHTEATLRTAREV